MKKTRLSLTVASIFLGLLLIFAMQSQVKNIKVERGLTKTAKNCVECHATHHPGIVADWKKSRHGHVGVSCLDCHQVEKDSKMAAQSCPGVKGTGVYISVLVTPEKCFRCHALEVKQFRVSGHFRARRQYMNSPEMHELIAVHEGQNIPRFATAAEETGCMQCHGSVIKLDKSNRPTKETWPSSGIGTVYPDGQVGNCTVCHTRHRFNIAEARRPDACASCHLGPDHPNIEIYENSKHGHMYKTEGATWDYDSAPDTWEAGDFRAPTCAVCHMSGIGSLQTTHNISARLKWNLWAKESKIRNSPDPLSPLTGEGYSGRKMMIQVCANCHSNLHTAGFFSSFDKNVDLYNTAYWKPARKMFDELKKRGLLKTNLWADEFGRIFYHLWHHQGRRMRQGAAMGGPDYAHWHGVFELQQDIAKLREIYKQRIKKGNPE